MNKFSLLSLILLGCVSCSSVRKVTMPMSGSDRDAHGCIGTAGYTWSEVQKDCIRLFEKGIRVKEVDGDKTAFIVFSKDSTLVELFFSSERGSKILERRLLPLGGYTWNIEDDDTENVRFEGGIWTISKRGKPIYGQKALENDPSLGSLQIRTFEGILPSTSSANVYYTLTIRSQEHSGNGTFLLVLTRLNAKNEKEEFRTYQGKRFTLRGTPENENATVWQLVTDDEKETFNFLRENNDELTMLNEKLEREF